MSVATELTRIQKSKDILATAMSGGNSNIRKCKRLELDHTIEPDNNGIYKIDDGVYGLSHYNVGYIGVSGSDNLGNFGGSELIIVCKVLRGTGGNSYGNIRFYDTQDGADYTLISLTSDTDTVVFASPREVHGYLQFDGFDDGDVEVYLAAYERDTSYNDGNIGFINGTEKLDELAVSLYANEFSEN